MYYAHKQSVILFILNVFLCIILCALNVGILNKNLNNTIMAKKITQTIQREIVDVSTGELIKVDTQKVFTEKINPNHFYMTFLDYIAPLYKLKSVSARNTLDWCCEQAQYNTGIIELTGAKRVQLCECLGINNNQLTNNLKKLKELNLISGGKGQFKINPEIFWKGDLQSRKQLLEGKSLEVSFKIVENNEKTEE